MVSSTSERWKRTVGSHWDFSDEDEFVNLSVQPEIVIDVISTVHSLPSKGAATPLFEMKWMIHVMISALFLAAVGMLLRKGRTVLGPTPSFPWWVPQGCKSGTRQERNPIPRSKRKESNSNTAPPTVKRKRMMNTTNMSGSEEHVQAGSSGYIVSPEAQMTEACESSPATDTSQVAIDGESAKRVETPELIVEPSSQECTALDFQSTDRSDDAFVTMTRNSTMLVTKELYDGYDIQALITAANDAKKLAQTICVTQTVLSKHGLDPTLAAEWAMRRQISDLSAVSQRAEDDRRQMLDSLHRHRDREQAERHFQEMKAAAQYDPNWLEKVRKERDVSFHIVFRAFIHGVIIAFLYESFRHLPSDPSITSFVELLMGCGCDKAVTLPSYTDFPSQQISNYLMNVIYRWTPETIASPMCYTSCLGWSLISPLAIQFILHVCRCPESIHRLITSIMLLLFFTRSQLVTVGMDTALAFTLHRVLPQLILMLMCVGKVMEFYSHAIFVIQNEDCNVQGRRLQEILLTFDSLQWKLSLAPLFMILVVAVDTLHVKIIQ